MTVWDQKGNQQKTLTTPFRFGETHGKGVPNKPYTGGKETRDKDRVTTLGGLRGQITGKCIIKSDHSAERKKADSPKLGQRGATKEKENIKHPHAGRGLHTGMAKPFPRRGEKKSI